MSGDRIARIAWSILSPKDGPKPNLYAHWPTLSEYYAMHCEAVVVLDALIEFYDGGKRWSRRYYKSSRGRYNLSGALAEVRKDRTAKDTAESFVGGAIFRTTRKRMHHDVFNRNRRNFEQIHAMLLLAREMAQGTIHYHPRNPKNVK
jgi:hypothetical protein